LAGLVISSLRKCVIVGREREGLKLGSAGVKSPAEERLKRP
jgi:hypothetical protein